MVSRTSIRARLRPITDQLLWPPGASKTLLIPLGRKVFRGKELLIFRQEDSRGPAVLSLLALRSSGEYGQASRQNLAMYSFIDSRDSVAHFRTCQ